MQQRAAAFLRRRTSHATDPVSRLRRLAQLHGQRESALPERLRRAQSVHRKQPERAARRLPGELAARRRIKSTRAPRPRRNDGQRWFRFRASRADARRHAAFRRCRPYRRHRHADLAAWPNRAGRRCAGLARHRKPRADDARHAVSHRVNDQAHHERRRADARRRRPHRAGIGGDELVAGTREAHGAVRSRRIAHVHRARREADHAARPAHASRGLRVSFHRYGGTRRLRKRLQRLRCDGRSGALARPRRRTAADVPARPALALRHCHRRARRPRAARRRHAARQVFSHPHLRAARHARHGVFGFTGAGGAPVDLVCRRCQRQAVRRGSSGDEPLAEPEAFAERGKAGWS